MCNHAITQLIWSYDLNLSTPDTNLSLNSLKKLNFLTYDQFLAVYFLSWKCERLRLTGIEKMTKKVRKKELENWHPERNFFLHWYAYEEDRVLTQCHFFGRDTSTTSTIFYTWIKLLYCHLNNLRGDMFPQRQHYAHDLPRVFRTFKNIRCTIDCTEFFVQMQRDFRRQGNLYSSYKNLHTFKSLIGVAPNGSIVFVSDLFEG